MENSQCINPDQDTTRYLIAIILSGISLFVVGIAALWGVITLVPNLPDDHLPFGFSAAMIIFTGVLFFFLFSICEQWNDRRHYTILLLLSIDNFLIVGGAYLMGMPNSDVSVILSMVLLSLVVGISSLLARTYVGSLTGIVLSKNTTIAAMLLVAAVTKTAGIPEMWSSGSLWGRGSLFNLFSGIFGSLVLGGAVALLAVLVLLAITAIVIISKGIRILSEHLP
ncbi:MAG: hypothetical protein WC620_10535 [Methanoregula sp.]|jgi:hypothetical protein